MPYTVTDLITGAFYTSGIVSREFQTVQGSQLNDGLNFLNDILDDKTVENNMIPYYSTLQLQTIQGQEKYFIQGLEEIDTITFFISGIRYSMTKLERYQYFGTPRANNIQSLPFTWHLERAPGGANVYLYFLPNASMTLEIYGLFRLSEVQFNQDLTNSLTTFNLGNPLLTGTGTLAPGQFVINQTDMVGAYASIAAFIVAINALQTGVRAAISSNQLMLTSGVNILLSTTGGGAPANTITFSNFTTLAGPYTQTYFPLFLDRFYITYLKYALARRLCAEYNYIVPPLVTEYYLKYEGMISKRTQHMDLKNQKMSTLSEPTSLNWAQVNLGLGWTI